MADNQVQAFSGSAVCVDAGGCDDLRKGTIYRVLPDAVASRVKYLRVIDDSGEDYLYPARLFRPCVG